MVLFLIVLVGFVSLAVDIGRMRLAKAELQTAADAAAIAGAAELKNANAVATAQDAAVDAAFENPNIDTDAQHGERRDTAVNMVPDQDIEFGVWATWRNDPDQSRPSFHRMDELGSGVDERREANAVRAWGRRVTAFTDTNSVGVTQQYTRNDGLKLIFAPALPNGPLTGEIQTTAVAALKGGSNGGGFVGLDSVKFNGTTKTDSYHSATESYPGADGVPNKNSAIASNGDITLVGGAQIWGDVHPGVNGQVQPYPLSDNVEVTGYLNPLAQPLSYPTPKYQVPTSQPVYPAVGKITPNNAYDSNTGAFAPPQPHTTITIDPGNYVFSSWTTKSQQTVKIDNHAGDVNIWVNGSVTQGAQAELHVVDDSHVVTFWVNGNFKMDGGGIWNDKTTSTYTAKPYSLNINVTKAGTSVDVGGNASISAHIMAPLSDVKVHGSSNKDANGFFGWAVGKTLTVDGNMVAHYDESLSFPQVTYKLRLVE